MLILKTYQTPLLLEMDRSKELLWKNPFGINGLNMRKLNKSHLQQYRVVVYRHMRSLSCTLSTSSYKQATYSSGRKLLFELAHGKTYKMESAPNQESDQPGHPPSDQSSLCAQ